MKRKYKLVLTALIAGLAILLLVSIEFPLIDPSFATKATLRFHYVDKSIDTTMTDKDLRALKEILRGRAYRDSPACGFGIDTSITLTDGHKSITFCPACDTCTTIQIGETNRYIDISEKERSRFDRIVAKYGMTFPCE